MEAAERLVGAVLAGGASRRMGRPKALMAMPDGRPMAAAVAGTLEEVCEEVVIVGSSVGGLARWRHVPDRRPGLGPLGGIEALLASGLASAYVVCPCDVPLIRADLLAMLAAPCAEPASAFVVAGEREPRPLPLRLDGRCLGDLQALLAAGRRACRDLLARVQVRAIEVPAACARALANVNTPADYEALRRA